MVLKFISLLMAFVLATFILRAQNASLVGLEPGTYKYKSYKQLEYLHKKLVFDTLQYKKVENVLLDFYRSVVMLPVSEDSLTLRGHRVLALQNVLKGRLRQILTTSQFRLYQQELESLRQRRNVANRPEQQAKPAKTGN